VSPTAGLEVLEKRNIFAPDGIRTPDLSARDSEAIPTVPELHAIISRPIFTAII